MRVLEIAVDIDLDGPGTATGTAIDLMDGNYDFPFQPGHTVVSAIAVDPFGEDAEGKLTLQGREATTDSWEDLHAVDVGPVKYAEIELKRYLRYAVQSATAADGRGSIHLLGN